MPEVVRIKGLPDLQAAIKKAPLEIARAIKGAGEESANEILDTRGLRSYPPNTSANLPPTPYYIRGRGTQYATKNAKNSERYGTKFTVRTTGYGTVIGNSASYSPYLAGEEQAQAMGEIGWRRLIDVAREKLPQIERIFSKWIERALRKAGL